MPTPIDDLITAVTGLSASVDNAISLLQSLKALADNAVPPAQIVSLTDQVGVKTGQLNDAITANTPTP
jgi:hypothetical protein